MLTLPEFRDKEKNFCRRVKKQFKPKKYMFGNMTER